MPAMDLLTNLTAYGEPMMKRPYGMIQSARGCPYQCNFCVKSYELSRLDPLISNLGSGGVIEDKLSYDIIFICVLYEYYFLCYRALT